MNPKQFITLFLVCCLLLGNSIQVFTIIPGLPQFRGGEYAKGFGYLTRGLDCLALGIALVEIKV